MKCQLRSAWSCLVACLFTPAQFAYSDDGPTWGAAQEQVVAAIAQAETKVASIALIRDVTVEGPLVDPFGLDSTTSTESPEFVPFEFGSGVLITNESDPDVRFVLTNYHVIHGTRLPDEPVQPARLMIRLPSRHTVWANEIAGDPRSDLSVLSLDLAEAGLTAEEVAAFTIREASVPQKGQLVITLGNPYAIARDGSASASIGIISNIARRGLPSSESQRPTDPVIHDYGTLLTIDTRLEFGSSGGALVDLDGNLIGLTTSLAALEGYEASAGYAIPFDASFTRVVDSLLAGHEVEYGYLGVTLRDVLQSETAQWGQISQPTAAAADHIATDSPAERGGLERGDVILSVNESTVFGAADVTREISLLEPGASARLNIFRPAESQTLSIEVRLGKCPVHNESAIVVTARRWPLWNGIGVDYPTARRRFMPFEVPLTYRRAVVVTEVVAGSAAERAGIKLGDMISTVNGTAVETPGEFHAAVDDAEGDAELILMDGRRVVLAASAEQN